MGDLEDLRASSLTPWLVYPLLSKMNLALIDPFQLAQDYPDALTNDLREC